MLLFSRRAVVLTLPALAVTGPALADIRAADFAAIERVSGGKLGVHAIDTATGETYSWRANQRFPFCSSFKAPLAAFVLWHADRGALRLDTPVRYTAAELLPYAPVTRVHVAAGHLSFERLCAAAVEYSDNTAANLLLRETGGPAALTAWMRKIGDAEFRLGDSEPKLNLARFGGEINTTTPRAMAESYRRLVLGDVLTSASRARLTGWLVANTTGGKRLRAGLPTGWQAGDKTGTYDGAWFSTVDIGVAWPPNGSPLVISGLLTDTPDTVSAERALAEIARQVASLAPRRART